MAAINYGTIAVIPKGVWDSAAQYNVANLVTYDGSSYLAHTVPPVGTLPTDASYWQVSAQGTNTASADAIGVVKPDGETITIDSGGTISAKKATESTFGIVSGGSNGVTVGSDGVMGVDTTFTQATELANIVAAEAFSSVLGKVSKAIATTMSLDENALLKNMLSSIDVNDTGKIPTSAYIHKLVERIGMGTDLDSGDNLTAAVNWLNSNSQEQIDQLRTFVGYEEDDIYGVEVDFVNKKFTRLAGAKNMIEGNAFSTLIPWNRRRCIVSNDGTVLAYRGEAGYVETGKTSMEITVNGTKYPAGTIAQVMVEQPVFYTKVVPVKAKDAASGRGKQLSKARYYISATPKTGFMVNDAFRDNNGIIQNNIYLSAYEGCLWDTSASAYLKNDEQVANFATDLLCSIAEAKPASGLTQSLTRANTRKLCTNRGAGWQLHNIFALSVTQWLILVEYASFDSQGKIGRGVSTFTEGGSTNMSLVTGATSGIGNGSGIPAGGENGKCSVSYRGEENLWGNIWSWLDGINHYAKDATTDTVFVKGYGSMTDDASNGYSMFEANIIRESGYLSAFGYDEQYPYLFLPTERAGSSDLPIGDYTWNDTGSVGFLVVMSGGMWSNVFGSGAWCSHLNYNSSMCSRFIGGRLLYVPQSKIA